VTDQSPWLAVLNSVVQTPKTTAVAAAGPGPAAPRNAKKSSVAEAVAMRAAACFSQRSRRASLMTPPEAARAAAV